MCALQPGVGGSINNTVIAIPVAGIRKGLIPHTRVNCTFESKISNLDSYWNDEKIIAKQQIKVIYPYQKS
jgi:hypothetical protein